jgi:creatinine amidohydrolase/Fe(II)-dependent formamide hydrolase-like protein/7-cyano-7-deazaguanine synthase in queuosine biosynthesis
MIDEGVKNIQSLTVFKKLLVGPPEITKNRVSATYTLFLNDDSVFSNTLIYKYEEEVFKAESILSQNLASILLAQVAINYGLFFKEIVFDGLYDEADKRFINDMVENTSREIFVNKLLFRNEYLKKGYDVISHRQAKRYTNAKIKFQNSFFKNSKLEWSFHDNDSDSYVILSSGGKDSLLSYGLMKDLKKTVHPVFINESGRHWFTALNAYRHLSKTDSNTARVWCNSDRIFNWMLKQMPFIRDDFQSIRSDIYPIRLWTVAVFLFGVLPLAMKRNAGRILIGDEYDTTIKNVYKGITHYNALYDQSRYFDNACTRYFMKKGWNMNQFSILRSLSEMLIEKILASRYPKLLETQVSCHAASNKGGKIFPCGKCEKCRRIVGMLKALDKDPAACGYNAAQIKNSLEQLSVKTVKQIGSDAEHLYYLLLNKGLLEKNTHTESLARPHPYIMKLRFDGDKSSFGFMPADIRQDLVNIYLQYADGAVLRKGKLWHDFDVLHSYEIEQAYPFEVSGKYDHNSGISVGTDEFVWEKMSWVEIEERLKLVDTAILPCGSIEQHGPHLPVDIDYFDAVYLAKKVAEACSAPRPFLLPPIPFGVSYHHDDFKGTISISNNALSQLVYDIGINLAKQGIKKLIILNGHGDNAPTLNYAAQMINRDAQIFVTIDTGETSDDDISRLIETPNDIHAGEIETSTTLAIRPDLVKMELAKDTTLGFGSTYLDYSSARSVPWYVHTKRITETGVMGNPTKASAEKGKRIWEIMIAHLVSFVEEIKSRNLEELYQKKY